MAEPSFEAVLAAAARLQELVPDAVLVGGSAAAHHDRHRVSFDDDHVVADLTARFDEVLDALEASDGWVTARVRRPVLILGRLDGLETGVRNLRRRRPLEVEEVDLGEARLRVPTLDEIVRIKAWMVLVRNATRDHLDVAGLVDAAGNRRCARTVAAMDEYYEDQQGPGGRRVATQMVRQLADPAPYDLDEVDLARYRQLRPPLQDWTGVVERCRRLASAVLDLLAGEGELR